MLKLLPAAAILVAALGSSFTERGRQVYFVAAPVLVAVAYYFALRAHVKEKCGNTDAMKNQEMTSLHALPLAVAVLSGVLAIGTEIAPTILFPGSALATWLATEAGLAYATECLPGQ
jgi:uncharacterized membrane protein YfcA